VATDAEKTLLRYLLIVDELDETGESTVCSSMSYLRVNVFPSTEPFSLWSDAKRMRIATEVISSLGHDGLVEFWEPQLHSGKRYVTAAEAEEWIQAHRLSLSEVERELERLTPIWWTGDCPEDVRWGTTSTGEALFHRWFYQPPTELR
jgi:hypothetical protein